MVQNTESLQKKQGDGFLKLARDIRIKMLRKNITRKQLMEALQMSSQHLTMALTGRRQAALIRVADYVNRYSVEQEQVA